jgi:hypothetical protein
VIAKREDRFPAMIMRKEDRMIPKSGYWFSDKIMRKEERL